MNKRRSKSAARDLRGAKARKEMREKGYIQTSELAEKLTAELGKTVTISSLRSHHARGRIQGELHKASNIWFFPADTKIPEKLTGKRDKNPKQAQGQGRDEPMALGPWANWPAPIISNPEKRYQVGWFGGSYELP